MAVAFQVIGVLFNGWSFLLLTCVGYIPGFFIYVKARKDYGNAITMGEKVCMGVISALGVLSLVLLAMGVISDLVDKGASSMDIKTIGVEDWLNVWEKSATYDIAQSTIASMTMGEILQLDGQAGATFYDRLNQEKMNYGWIEGSPEFKAEVAKLYRTEIDPDCILQTNGTTGANLMALMQLVEPGDHVIAEYPTYQPLYEIPRTLGAEVEYWHLREENGWNPSIDELKELVRPDTKLICINNASNPLGAVLDRETLEQIVEIAQSVGAYVLSDEVYLPLENTENFWSMADLYDQAPW